MKTTGLILILALLCAMTCFASPSKRVLTVAEDGYPTGYSTPEGAACDLARAFIRRDPSLFESTCIRPFGGGQSRAKYEAFLKQTAASIAAEAKKTTPSAGGPTRIGKVFAARHLTQSGPVSYGYAMFGFNDVEFVDVGVFLHDGSHVLNRTFVIQDSNGKWYVDPDPTVSPLLSAGLNDEMPSTADFSEAYSVKAAK